MIRSLETERPKITRRDLLMKAGKGLLIVGTGVGVVAELKFSIDRAIAEDSAKKAKQLKK